MRWLLSNTGLRSPSISQSAQRHLTFEESGPYDLPQTQQSLSVHNYRHYATYRLSIGYSRLEQRSVAIALPDEVYRDGNGVYALPLVAGQAYRSSGYDMVVVLHVYQWANQVELLSGGGDMANGESILALDFRFRLRIVVRRSYLVHRRIQGRISHARSATV